MAKNGQKWPKMAKNGQKWPKIGENGQKWPKTAKNYQEWPLHLLPCLHSDIKNGYQFKNPFRRAGIEETFRPTSFQA